MAENDKPKGVGCQFWAKNAGCRFPLHVVRAARLNLQCAAWPESQD